MVTTLGIDIGTTSIKVCVVRNGSVVESTSMVHNAEVLSLMQNKQHSSSCLFNEQNPRILVTVLDICLQKVSRLLNDVSHISICGQMHGMLLWKPKINLDTSKCNSMESLFDQSVEVISNLVTWQDARCDQQFLQSLPSSPSNCNVSTGYGCATLIWLKRNQRNLDQFTRSGTIMDFMVWLLTQTDQILMTSHNAKSWGYYDMRKDRWEIEQLSEVLSSSISLLPEVVPVKTPAGYLSVTVHGINTSTVVYTALGDMQCSIRATKSTKKEAVLNIGTSTQLSMISNRSENLLEIKDGNPAIECVPYINNDVILTAASLNGGNVIDVFVKNIQSWLLDLQCSMPSKEDLFTKIEILAQLYKEENLNSDTLLIKPTVFGERYKPDELASIQNISYNTSTLGAITYATYRGLIENMVKMLPAVTLKQNGIDAVVGTGGTLRRSSVLRKIVEDVYKLPLRMCCEDDAAYGATLLNGDSSKQ